MLLKLTLSGSGGNHGVDILVDADPTTSLGALAEALARRNPARAGQAPPGAMTIRVEGPGVATTLDPATDLAGAALRSGDVVSLQVDGGRYVDGDDARAAAATLVVRDGPGVGATFALRRGANQAGREVGSDVRLSDPMVSKRHARFNVTDVVEVLDLASVNGVIVDGEHVDRAILRPGDQVLLGDTLLAVEQIRRTSGTGPVGPLVPFNRSPYLDPRFDGSKVMAPEPPIPPQPVRFPALAMVAPLLFGVIMYVFTRQLISVIFMALSPVMMVGTYVEGRRSAAQARRDGYETFRAALLHLDDQLTSIQGDEVARRRLEHPSTAQAVRAGVGLDPMFWTRRPDRHGFLDLRLGLASLPTRCQVEMPSTNNTLPGLWDELQDVVARHALVPDVPVVASLAHVGVVGVAGSTDDALGAGRGLVAQIAGLHSPAEVVLVAVVSNQAAPHWDWLKWLPHTTSEQSPLPGHHLAVGAQAAGLVADLRDLIDQRLAASTSAERSMPLPAVVVVVDDDVPVERNLLVEVAERGPSAGVFCIWVAGSVDALPAAATAFVDHDAVTHQALAGFIDGGRSITPVSSEPLSGADALAFGRAIAPVVDAGAPANEASDLPARVSFLDGAAIELAESAAAVIDRWRLSDSLPTPEGAPRRRRRRDLPLQAVVGTGGHGPLQLDLRTQGPHALVGGTTGAGKSEFLQSWIMGLATTHSPARVTFLFVDYKGGSAFAECVRLPHTVGMVTDLTPHLVGRALESLNAELRHREHILNRKKVKDVLELERTRDPETPPSLVIVVDEFAALVAEVPEFVDGVVNVAQRGRSLGLHLILATQRPAGVIKDNLRANTNLRVALRMADESDSDDVVGSDLAARFDPTIPGRGIAKLGPGRLSPFQAAYVGGWTTGVPPAPRITVSAHVMGAAGEWLEPESDTVEVDDEDLGPTDLQRVVDRVTEAAALAALAEPRKPWLAELASTYDLARNPDSAGDVRLISRTDEILTFGVLDDPADQAQVPVAFEPDRDGNMAVIGTGGSGKSAFLRTLAVAGALSTAGGPCHVYGLDFASRGLDMLAELPNVGSIVSGDDDERTLRLLRTLRSVIDERLVRYAAVRCDTVRQYREVAGRPDEPRILLLVDGYSAFRQEYEISGRQGVFDLFQSIATDGRQAGVHVVVAADRAGAFTSGLSSVLQKRLVLRLSNENEYSLASVPAGVFPSGSPPGRGYFNEREVQVAVLGGDPNAAVQASMISRLAAAARERGAVAAPPIGSLPDRVVLSDLPVADEVGPVFALADDTLGPIGIDLTLPLVVVGPPKSGKTTLLATIVAAVRRGRPDIETIYVGNGRSPLPGAVAWTDQLVPGPDLADRIDSLVSALRAAPRSAAGEPPMLLVIDDAAKVTNWGDSDRVAQLVEACSDAGGAVIADGETSAMGGTYGLLQVLKASRTGVVLVPDQYDGDALFKTAFPKLARRDFPPGRGLYVRGGRAHKVQVALPTEEWA